MPLVKPDKPDPQLPACECEADRAALLTKITALEAALAVVVAECQKSQAKPIDKDALIAELLAKMPPITVRTVDAQGSVRDEEQVHLGGILNLHHRPVSRE